MTQRDTKYIGRTLWHRFLWKIHGVAANFLLADSTHQPRTMGGLVLKLAVGFAQNSFYSRGYFRGPSTKHCSENNHAHNNAY